jgi:hypothetical protein
MAAQNAVKFPKNKPFFKCSTIRATICRSGSSLQRRASARQAYLCSIKLKLLSPAQNQRSINDQAAGQASTKAPAQSTVPGT